MNTTVKEKRSAPDQGPGPAPGQDPDPADAPSAPAREAGGHDQDRNHVRLIEIEKGTRTVARGGESEASLQTIKMMMIAGKMVYL